MSNPYSNLINIFRQEGSTFNPPAISIGEVISVSPLLIELNSIQLDKDNLLVSADLLPNYKTKIKIAATSKVTGKVQVGNSSGSVTELGINEAELEMVEVLQVGDSVAMLSTEDKQLFIVLCKVVRVI